MSPGLSGRLDRQEQKRNLIAFEIHDGILQYAGAALMHLGCFADLQGNCRCAETRAIIENGQTLCREGGARRGWSLQPGGDEAGERNGLGRGVGGKRASPQAREDSPERPQLLWKPFGRRPND